jgi:hypothetical protein
MGTMAGPFLASDFLREPYPLPPREAVRDIIRMVRAMRKKARALR